MDETMSHTQTTVSWARNVATAPAGYHSATRPGLPWGWWRANHRYTIYMLRELSSLFIALWSVRFVMQLDRMRSGKNAYEAVVAAQRHPLSVLLNLVTLLFAILHSVTFLQLAGTVQTVRLGARRLPAEHVTAGAFAGWAAASLMLLVTLLCGGRKEGTGQTR